jgi:DNA-binding beta-propeller fold protein YncE
MTSSSRADRSTASKGGTRARAALLALSGLVLLAASGAAPPGAGAEGPPGLFWQAPLDGKAGSGAGQLEAPGAVAADPISGHLYVIDSGNSRIVELNPWGEFVKAWGWGVVASGPDDEPQNEIQEVTVDATGGDFSLRFINPFGGAEDSAPIPFDSSAATVQKALGELEGLAPGDLSVIGPNGGPWTIEFTGEYADVDIPQLEVVESTLTGGGASADVKAVQGGANFEICDPAAGDVCRAGQGGDAAAGELPSPQGIAVGPGGDVYVYEGEGCTEGDGCALQNFRVQKFDSAGHFLLMFGGEVDKTSGENVCTAASGHICGIGTFGTGNGQFSNRSGGDDIDVGPTGTVFVGDVGRIQEFDAAGAYQGEIDFSALHEEDEAFPEEGRPVALDLDGAGNLYLALAGTADIYKLNPAGELSGPRFPTKAPSALAVDSTGNLFAVDDPVPGFSLAWLEPRIVEFDPTGKELIPTEAEQKQQKEAEEEIGVDREYFGQVAGTFLTGLATSAGCGLPSDDLLASHSGAEKSFVVAYGPAPQDAENCPPPKNPPTIEDQYATAVDGGGATVRAKINPHFWPDTRYYVEYGAGECSKGGCQVQPAPPGSLLTDEVVNAPLATSGVFLAGLQPATTYHYRFVAQSSGGGPVHGAGGIPGTDGQESTFTTLPTALDPKKDCPNQAFRTGPSAFLPDCRAYEMVSPLDKNGGDIAALGTTSEFFQGAADGNRFTFSSSTAFGDPLGAPFVSQYLASREEGKGWSTEAISPPRESRPICQDVNCKFQGEFKAFSDDLCNGWLVHNSGPTLAPDAIEGFVDLYRRDNCGGAGAYEAITTTEPEGGDVASFWPELQGLSADGTHAVFRVQGKLATDEGPEAANIAGFQLYERVDGKLRYVCVLPDGEATQGPCTAGTAHYSAAAGRQSSVNHAVSADGSRIFWSASEQEAGKLYVRIGGEETVALWPSGVAEFWTAAADGSKAVFTTSKKDHASDLYEFDVDSETPTRIARKVTGLLGASEDASRIYVVSREALDEGAVVGRPNLYLYEAGEEGEEGTFGFVAILSEDDAREDTVAGLPFGAKRPGIPSAANKELTSHVARVSPDGLHVAFQSNSKELGETVAGYDNTDANSGEADAEVYVYDAEEGTLACASCNPSGARPAGLNLGDKTNPAWTVAQIPSAESQLYAPRVFAEDGRVFFESFESLVLRDTNGRQDVYEWQPAGGEEACEERGAEMFVAASGGCLSLISSGQSPLDSDFVDASKDGADVFIKTGSSLLPQDPGLIDIYDARANGGFPAPEASPAACEGEACQGPPEPPDDPTPASSSFEGAGNVTAPRPRCTRPKVRRRGRCVAKKHHKHPKKKQADHERRGPR